MDIAVEVAAASQDYETTIADGMRIEWDVPIEMDDGTVLRADVFRPIDDGQYPIILSMGPYGKGLSFQEGYPDAWNIMVDNFPEVARGSTNKYQNWEVVDPEKWVPDGYACVRIDCRGAGRSPGYLDVQSPREIRDLYLSIEWAGRQPWSNGKVGMNGISYYGINQWLVAKHNPPSLAALCIWEGCSDMYREGFYTAGILNEMVPMTYEMQMTSVQHGRGERGPRSKVTGELVCGSETLSDAELTKNRSSILPYMFEHRLDDEWYRDRSGDFSKTTVPFLSAGNWGGQPLHTRGNTEGFMRARSEHKWLEMHGFEHWITFYLDYAIALQKRFFGHFLKGEDNGWDREPRVNLNVRHPGNVFVQRYENEWPLARTRWTKFYLDPATRGLTETAQAAVETSLGFDALGDGLRFSTPPLTEPLEITGPSAAKLLVSSSTQDADIFIVLRVFDPAGKEVLFRGALDPQTPVAQGWLRASHRKLDPAISEPYRPYHPHDEVAPLTPGVPVALDIEIWPTSIVIPAGYRLELDVLGRDFEHDEAPAYLSNMKFPMKGSGPFTHANAVDRPKDVFGGKTTLHFGRDGEQPYVLLPIIPAEAR